MGTASRLILTWSLVAVVLYACALPLWEGWDEPFHYGYVETLAVQREIPLLGKSTLSEEIAQSLTRTPLPAFLAQAVAGSVSFQQWHAISAAQQDQLRASLDSVSAKSRLVAGPDPNYEAHQAPLAYVLLVLPDSILSRVQLVPRVLLLRIVLAVASMSLVFAGVFRLASTLGIEEPYRDALLFCSLSVQVLWAALAHIGNDAVAIPLTLWFLVLLAEKKTLIGPAVLLGAGLLTKAYFLCFVPAFLAFCIASVWKRGHTWKKAALALAIVALSAGPWYARNLRHGSFSGTQESASGVTVAMAIGAVPHIHWLRSGLLFLRNTLWLGNWSYTAFPRGPVTALLVLALFAIILYLRDWKTISARELWLWSAVASFVGGLVYQLCATWVHTHGQTLTVDTWYWQGVVLAIWVMLFQPLQRAGYLGRGVMAACCALSAYIAAATFLSMLLPEYGAGLAKASLAAKLHWWRTDAFRSLSLLTLGPAKAVISLLGLFLLLLAVNLFSLTRGWARAWR